MRDGKIVTIVMFGPSLKLGVPVVGEVWTLNRAYDLLQPEVLDVTTRLFDMHAMEKLRLVTATDGRPHLYHLDALGKAGKRIVMTDRVENVTNSEAFPLHAIKGRWPHAPFSGGEQYPIAMALHEGYEHIRLIGVDLSDLKHAFHREGVMWWLGLAMGMGVRIDGPLRLISRYTKHYGYDYGGYGDDAWDEYTSGLTWEAFPFTIEMKKEWMPVTQKG